MKTMFKNEMKAASYESPSMVELYVAVEGVLCESSGTENLEEVEGSWA